jgi:hypothetical protein
MRQQEARNEAGGKEIHEMPQESRPAEMFVEDRFEMPQESRPVKIQ